MAFGHSEPENTSTLLLSQDLSDFIGEILHGKGLLDKVDALVQYAVVGDDLAGIAGGEQAFEPRLHGGKYPGKIAAVHFRHDDIGNDQMYRPAMLFHQIDCTVRRICRQNGIAYSLSHMK